GKRAGCRFIWLSATVDPAFYARYLGSVEVLETRAFGPARAADVRVLPQQPVAFLNDRFMKEVLRERRGVAVFVPTRAEVEQIAKELGDRWQGLPAVAELLRDLLDLGPSGHEHRDATPLPQDLLHEAIVQELERLLGQDTHIGRPRGIERPGLEDLNRSQVAGVERRIHRGGKPDEAAARSLAERQAQLELGRRLVDLIHDEGVPRGDEAVLEPTARDPGGHDHDVPGRRLGRGFPLAVHDADLERRLQDRRRNRPDSERLARARPGNDPEPPPRC